MKKSSLYLLSIIFLCTSFTTKAQVFFAKAGFNLSSTKYPSEGNYGGKDHMKPGFHVGAMLEFPLNDRLSVETGLILNNRGSTFRYTTWDAYYSTNYYYLDMPVLGKFYFPIGNNKRLFAALGPYLALGLIGWEEGTSMESKRIEWDEEHSSLKRLEMGATSGFGVEINRMQCGVYYDLGLTNMVSMSPDNWSKNRVLRFSVGYRFGKKRS